MCYTQSRFKALISACVMSLIATAGWSQSLTWLGTLPGGGRSWAYDVSADGAVVVGWAETPQGRGVPFAGRRLVGCKTSARWAAIGARLGVFPPTAPWWSAGLPTPQGRVVPFAGRLLVGCKNLGTLGGGWSWANDVSADGSVVVGWAQNAAGQGRAFRWTALGGMQGLGTLGGYNGARLMLFPPTAPWWSAGLKRRRAVSCLSLDGGGWDARPRHAGRHTIGAGLWCFRRRRRGGRRG
jgi:probable HAF family extracellular repeat protein